MMEAAACTCARRYHLPRSLSVLPRNLTDNKHYETTMDRDSSPVLDDSNTIMDRRREHRQFSRKLFNFLNGERSTRLKETLSLQGRRRDYARVTTERGSFPLVFNLG